jgi:glucose-6-phosphate 1-epimerase
MDELARIAALNDRFGIPGIVQILPGSGGLARVRVTCPAASAEIYLHGAQVTSWQPAGAEEAIFVSAHSRWKDGSAIRGGIPICFPWFRAKVDDPQAPAHGFVRTREWRLESVTSENDGTVVVNCSTESDESTLRWWPHEFRLVHRVIVGSSLRLELTATNTGTSAFSFEEALHTYFHVSDARSARVRGLDQVRYLDNTDANREKIQSGDVIFKGATDNAYIDALGTLELIDPIAHRALRTEKENSATTVVWNPWQPGAAALSDLGDGEWEKMACVEASNILGAAARLEPGQQHVMRATISNVAG